MLGGEKIPEGFSPLVRRFFPPRYLYICGYKAPKLPLYFWPKGESPLFLKEEIFWGNWLVKIFFPFSPKALRGL